MTGFLFLRPRGLFGRLIGAVTHHEPGVPEVCHVAVVLGEAQDGTWQVGESWAGEGVRMVRWSKEDAIFVPYDFDRPHAMEWFVSHSGQGYDWLALPWMAVVGMASFVKVRLRRNPFQSRSRWYCSEAAITATETEALFGATQVTPQAMLNMLYRETGR